MTNKERSAIIKEINRLRYNVRRRTQAISKRSDLPQYAVNRFREYEEGRIGKDTRSLKDSEIRKMYRDIRYINDLKSSSVKGSESVKRSYEPIRERVDKLSEDTQKSYYELYNKILETAPLLERFKYDIMDVAMTMTENNMRIDESLQRFFDEYRQYLLGLDGDSTDETTRLFFSEFGERL